MLKQMVTCHEQWALSSRLRFNLAKLAYLSQLFCIIDDGDSDELLLLLLYYDLFISQV